jgi:hypothetical protein
MARKTAAMPPMAIPAMVPGPIAVAEPGVAAPSGMGVGVGEMVGSEEEGSRVEDISEEMAEEDGREEDAAGVAVEDVFREVDDFVVVVDDFFVVSGLKSQYPS